MQEHHMKHTSVSKVLIINVSIKVNISINVLKSNEKIATQD